MQAFGILTYHYSYNEGAILQAYALAQALKEHGAPGVEIIDHRYPAKVAIYNRELDPRKRRLATAIDHWLPLSPRRFFDADEKATWHYVCNRYRTLVIGSDQVWRTKYTSSWFGLRLTQSDHFVGRFPNVYWPPASLPVEKCSYAASIGDSRSQAIPRSHLVEMAKRLGDFRIIGVRDEQTAEFVERLSPSLRDRIYLCPDPTWLIDWRAHSCRGYSTLDKVSLIWSGRPSCLLAVNDTPLAHDLSKKLKERGFAVIGYGSWDKYSAIKLYQWGLSLTEWIALFGTVDICITDRMHAFIFSIIGHCPCIVLDNGNKGAPCKSRLYDLCQRLEYPYRVDVTKDASEILHIAMSLTVDWAGIDSRLSDYRRTGHQVLSEIVQRKRFGSEQQ